MFIYLLGTCRVVFITKYESKYTYIRNNFLLNQLWELDCFLKVTNDKVKIENVNTKKFREPSTTHMFSLYTQEERKKHMDYINKANYIIIEIPSIKKKDNSIFTETEFHNYLDSIISDIKTPIIFVTHLNLVSDITKKLIKNRVILESYMDKYVLNKKNMYLFKPNQIFDDNTDVNSYKEYLQINKKNRIDLCHYSDKGYKFLIDNIEKFIDKIEENI